MSIYGLQNNVKQSNWNEMDQGMKGGYLLVGTDLPPMSQLHAEESVLVRRQALNCLVSTCRKQFQKYQDLADPTPAALANAMDLPCRTPGLLLPPPR